MNLNPFLMIVMHVHSMVSKLMIDGKLHGSRHQSTSTTAMQNAEPSRLRSLAMQFADKASIMHAGPQRCQQVVSKLMMDEKLHGSWDQPTSTIVMHNAKPSRLQSLAMQFADKAATMVDLNERALTLRTGGLRDSEDDMGRGYQEGGGSRRSVCRPC